MTLKSVKGFVIQYLKSAAVKAALLKFLGSAVSGGWRAWIIKFIVAELFEEIAEPIIKAVFRQMGYMYDRVEGEIKFKQVEKAEENNDEKAHTISVSNIFN